MKNLSTLIIALFLGLTVGHAEEYHVAKSGSDLNPGTKDAPFLTISKAATVARSGDVVTVHAGTYREWVNPRNSGSDKYARITYQAAEGEEAEDAELPDGEKAEDAEEADAKEDESKGEGKPEPKDGEDKKSDEGTGENKDE